MLKALFTLDYEIHGNGEGDPYALMIEPTDRMLQHFETYGAKLTIFADIGEILQFKRYRDERGRDDCNYQQIENQLQNAIRRGHDVQLHIHSSYFNAHRSSARWIQDWSEYNFAGLSFTRASEMIRLGKEFLEKLLRPVDPNYRCFVFRAANWAMSPSRNAIMALVANGITIDTSVFRFGKRRGMVNFDYSEAPSSVIPWRASNDDICTADSAGCLNEFPIYSENRWIGAFLTPSRIYRAALTKLHRPPKSNSHESSTAEDYGPRQNKPNLSFLRKKYAWKADFNQCSGKQLIKALERAEDEYRRANNTPLPFVLIGHSKLYTRFNQWSLSPFLAFIANNPHRFGFARFADFDLGRLNAIESGAA